MMWIVCTTCMVCMYDMLGMYAAYGVCYMCCTCAMVCTVCVTCVVRALSTEMATENTKGAYKEFKNCICTETCHKKWPHSNCGGARINVPGGG